MLTDDEIAVPCDVARSAGTDLSRDKTALLPELIASGYVAQDREADAAWPRYRLTSAGSGRTERAWRRRERVVIA